MFVQMEMRVASPPRSKPLECMVQNLGAIGAGRVKDRILVEVENDKALVS